MAPRKGSKRKATAEASASDNVKVEETNKNEQEAKMEFEDPESTNYKTPSKHPKCGNLAENYLKMITKLNDKLNDDLKASQFAAPYIVYNPIKYAFDVHTNFVRKYCTEPKKLLFLGMNPGPFGMCQTGIPFGEVVAVKEWLKVTGRIDRPDIQAEARPILGFKCTRSEVSGKRFWAYFKELCNEPDKFFTNAFVYNHCPLAFITKAGKNVTPKEIKGFNVDIIKHCDETLSEIIQLLGIEVVIGLGRYAEKQAQDTIKKYKLNNVKVVFLPHPSPRAVGNIDWNTKVDEHLERLQLKQYF